ncbi:MAG: SusC/RagA family protein [Candidatus Nephrothrix sp. EaCA]|nr:MAG: SusC/RagA family protein [Candidatus Nephrothrix sp. EaCA]
MSSGSFLKKICLASFLILCSCVLARAQDRTVSGKVVDAAGEGIPAINIIQKGTTNGTATDIEGNFSLSVPDDATLVVTGIGYKTLELPVGNQSHLNLTMEEDQVALSEVIVTGYSVDNRREIAGSVSVVKSQDLKVVPSGNVEQQLQGRVSGVTVITNGQPGTTSQIRVRGFGSFENNEPLYVVDGVPVSTTDFLNPDDIENVTVLKDAASASIYGARASSGVIVYTTKSGKRNAKKLSVTYDGMYGVTTPGQGQKMLSPDDFSEWTRNVHINSKIASHRQFGSVSDWRIPDYLLVGTDTGVRGPLDLNAERAKYNVDFSLPIYQVIAPNRQGTDWYKEITRNAPLTRHSIGLSGGGEYSRYYVGFGLQDQQGILLNNSFKRYSLRANTEFDVSKKVRVGENVQFTYRQALGLGGGNGGRGVSLDENDILFAFRMPSIIPVYDVFGGYAGTTAQGFNNGKNPVARRERLKNNRAFNVIGFGNIYVEFEPIKGLVFKSNAGGNYRGNSFRNYDPRSYENSENNKNFTFSEGSDYLFGWNWTNTASYKKVFAEKHHVDILAGEEALDTGSGRSISGHGVNPYSSEPDYVSLALVNNRQVSSEQFKGVTFFSLFSQLRYSYSDKYIATAVVRRDGSSRFGSNNRFGVFPAFSAAWRISSENFMKSFAWLNDLKLRVGYGTMGNSNAVDPANQYTLYGASISEASYDLGGTNTSATEGYYRFRIGNPDAKWETCVTKNIGFDAAFFTNKLEISLDFWQKDTRDLLVRSPLPATIGFRGLPPFVNSGQMVNKGIDIQIATKGKATSDISYEVSVNGSFLSNEITGIRDGLSYLDTYNPNYRSISPIRNQLGHSLSSFYGYKVLGLFANEEEVKNAPDQKGTGAPGRFRFADVSGPNGKPDHKIDEDDRTYLGSPVPKFTGGLNFSVKYKSYEIGAYFYTSLGGQIFNMSKWFTDFYPSFAGAGKSERVKNSWTPSNTGATTPIFESASNFSTNTQSSSFYVESGSYLRMQNLSFAYHLPQNILTSLKIERLKAFASVNNLFTLTRYSGLDPAVGGSTDTIFGIDIGNYPVTQSFTLGVSLGF